MKLVHSRFTANNYIFLIQRWLRHGPASKRVQSVYCASSDISSEPKIHTPDNTYHSTWHIIDTEYIFILWILLFFRGLNCWNSFEQTFSHSVISSTPIFQLPMYADNLVNLLPLPEILFQISDLYILLSTSVNGCLRGSSNSRYSLENSWSLNQSPSLALL